jgi:CSLREA domain-containing protein
MTSVSRILLLASAVVALVPAGAHAAAFTVDSTGDQTDATPGNGVCATAGGQCTLRAAIVEANALMGADAITVPAGTYNVGSSLPVSTNITINGAGARDVTVRATTGIVIQVTGDAVVTGLTVTGGTMGMLVSGAELTLDRVTIANNAVSTAGNVVGAGMRVDTNSKVLIRRSAITGNTATSTGGTSYGAGIYASSSQLDIRSTTIASNTVTGSSQGRGGGILAIGGTVSLRHVTLSGNVANSGTLDRYGGNLYVTGTTPTVTDSILTGGVANAGHENCSSAAATLPTASGRNIDSGTSCGFGAGQLSSTDPQLESLANAGGQTDARVPKRTSPAVGQAATCPDDAIDQRGAPAPSGTGCDIGAAELSANLGVTLVQARTATGPGSDVAFVARVTNTGFDAAETAALDVTLAGATEVPLVVPSAGTCTTAIRCELGTIASGGQVTVAFVLRAGAGGTLAAAAAVSSSTPQSTTADDAAAASLPVQTTGDGGGAQPAAPVLGALKLSGRARSGRAIRLTSTLSANATVALRVERLLPGRRSGARCSTKATRGKRCTIARLVGRRTHAGRAGAVTITLPRLIAKRKLAPGRYRVTAQATGSGGLRSATRTVTITVRR